jgi:muramidase (phage lysozyme)
MTRLRFQNPCTLDPSTRVLTRLIERGVSVEEIDDAFRRCWASAISQVVRHRNGAFTSLQGATENRFPEKSLQSLDEEGTAPRIQ